MSALRLARGVHRPPQDPQVRRLLPRPRRRPAGRGRLRRRDARHPRLARRARGHGRRHAGGAVQRPGRGRAACRRARRATWPPSSSSRWPATWAAWRRARASWRRCASSRDARGALLIFDEVMTGFRLAPGGAQAALRRHARPHLPGQDHRRRPARRARTAGRADDHGPRRARRARLPGGHAVRQPAGHGRRVRRCSTRLARPGTYERLEALDDRACRRACARAAQAAGVDADRQPRGLDVHAVLLPRAR